MVTKAEREWGGRNEQFGIKTYTQLHRKEITDIRTYGIAQGTLLNIL